MNRLCKHWAHKLPVTLSSDKGGGDSLNDNASGLLLHPSVGEDVNEYVVMQNHRIQFATVDLSAPATEIREQLLNAIQSS